jgi:hypothetical protein
MGFKEKRKKERKLGLLVLMYIVLNGKIYMKLRVYTEFKDQGQIENNNQIISKKFLESRSKFVGKYFVISLSFKSIVTRKNLKLGCLHTVA